MLIETWLFEKMILKRFSLNRTVHNYYNNFRHLSVFEKTTKIEKKKNKDKNKKKTRTKTKRKKTKTKEQRDVYGVIAYSFRHDQYPIHRLCVATSVYILQRLFMYSHLESNSWIYQINCTANMHNPYIVQMAAMQEAGFWILRGPEYFFMETTSFSFLTFFKYFFGVPHLATFISIFLKCNS